MAIAASTAVRSKEYSCDMLIECLLKARATAVGMRLCSLFVVICSVVQLYYTTGGKGLLLLQVPLSIRYTNTSESSLRYSVQLRAVLYACGGVHA